MNRYHLNLLGSALCDLSPLIEAALRELDKPGSRALRRKIDGRFHFAVFAYEMLQREEVAQCDWSKLDLPRYQRVTQVWPAREAIEARKAARDRSGDAPPVRGHALQVVVDNTVRGRVRAGSTLTDGDAA